MPTKISIVLSLTAVLLGACSERVKDTHPQQLVTKRQEMFKAMTRALEPMGLVARERESYNRASFQARALELQDLATQPWALFSADGNYPPTRAKPEVWQKAADFKQAQARFQALTADLVKVSGSADMPAIRSAVDAVEKSCKSCHEQFRNER